MRKVSNLSIPDSVESIGQYAFFRCNLLVEEENGVQYVGKWATSYNSDALPEKASLRSNTHGIADGAFYYSRNLTEITIPESVTLIGSHAFRSCAKLASIDIPDSVVYIGEEAFFDCPSLNRVTLPNGIDNILSNTFGSCLLLTKAVIPDSVKTIGQSAFSDCVNLISVTLGKNVNYIGENAFNNCSKLVEIVNKSSINIELNAESSALGSIGKYALDIHDGESNIFEQNDFLFYTYDDVNYLLAYVGNATVLTLPENYNGQQYEIYKSAFHHNFNKITDVTISSGVSRIGDRAFYNCTSLKNVIFENGVTSIGKEAFAHCTSLKKIKLPDSVTEIQNYAFFYLHINSIELGSGLVSIKENAFYSCPKLVEIINRSTLNLSKGSQEHGNIAENALDIHAGDSKIIYQNDYCFYTVNGTNYLVGYYGVEDSLALPKNYNGESYKINNQAFVASYNLKQIVIPESVTDIGEWAFGNCHYLKKVEFCGATAVSKYAFSQCHDLAEVIIPSQVNSIAQNAFASSNNVVIFGIPESYAQQYANDRGIPFVAITYDTSRIILTVLNEQNIPVTKGYEIIWYDESGTKLGSGNMLSNAALNKKYYYKIVLSDELAKEFFLEHDSGSTTTSSTEITETVVLRPIKSIEINGKLVDENGAFIGEADILAVMQFGAGVTSEHELMTAADGSFSLEIKAVATTLYFFADGYYSRIVVLSENQLKQDKLTLPNTVLKELSKNVLTLKLNKLSSALSGDTPELNEISELVGMSFEIYNVTQNKKISVFEVKNDKIYIGDGEIAPCDILEITVTDVSGNLAPAKIDIYTDDMMTGYAEATLTEKGIVRINELISKKRVTVMIFDSNGKLLTYSNTTSSYESPSLDAGKYILVALEYSPNFARISSIEYLGKLGLGEKDYLRSEINVADGKITAIETLNVPELSENSVRYTVSENTRFTASRTVATLGQYVILRCQYEIDPKITDLDKNIVIDIPENLQFVEGSLTLNDSVISCTAEGGKLTIPIKENHGVIRFYVVPSIGGKYVAQAYLETGIDGIIIAESIGSVTIETESIKLSHPEETANERVTVSGIAVPNSEITLYDGNVEIGKTQSNRIGEWELIVQLNNVSFISLHNLHAVIDNKYFTSPLYSETSTLIHNSSFTQVKTVTIVSQSSTAVIDFKKANQSYGYIPGEDYFTFIVDFEYNSAVPINVSVVTKDENQIETIIPCIYDPAKNVYIGSKYFNGNIPHSISVYYDLENKNNEPVSTITEEELQKLVERTTDAMDNMVKDLEENLVCGDITTDENGIYFPVVYAPTNDSIGTFVMDIVDISEIDLSAGGFENFDINGETAQIKVFDEELFQVILVLPQYEVAARYTLTGTENAFVVLPALPIIAGWALKALTAAGIGLGVAELLQVVEESKVDQFAETYWELFNQLYGNTLSLMTLKCPDGSFRLSSEDLATARNRLANSYDKALDWYIDALDDYAFYQLFCKLKIGKIIASLGVSALRYKKNLSDIDDAVQKQLENVKKSEIEKTCDLLLDQLVFDEIKKKMNPDPEDMSTLVDKIEKLSDNMLDLIGILTITAEKIEENVLEGYDKSLKELSELNNWIYNHYKKCQDPDDNQIPYPKGTKNTPEILTTPAIDPSGYVCEAVPSNRLEGVRVEAYYYDYELDEFGVPTDNKTDIFWDAGEYSQVNPLYTDKDGRYAWDVPVGKWLVKFYKEGYLPADSRNDPAADDDGYLPVPPPQTEVNIALISTALPTVQAAHAYNDRVRIQFSQYMELDSLNTSSVTITANGQQIGGMIRPVNAEASFDDPDIYYASIFIFETDSEISGSIELSVSGAVNYAGNRMATDYKKNLPVELLPTAIEVTNEINVEYSSGALISIQLNSPEAGANKTVEFASLNESIVSVYETSVKTDASGKATVMINGELPGIAKIRITVPGTDLEQTVTVTVTNVNESNPNRCEKVVASIETGATVEKGTKISLSTTTEGAEIYYTLDKSCPCDKDNPARIKYTAPIEITEDTFIIAYAVMDGKADSMTAGFAYTVTNASAPDQQPNENGNISDGNDNNALTIIIVVTVCTLLFACAGVITLIIVKKKKPKIK